MKILLKNLKPYKYFLHFLIMKKQKEKHSLSELIEQYLFDNPILFVYASEDLLNLSSLARKIKSDLNLNKSHEAILISLYRILEKQRKIVKKDDIKTIFKNTTINIYSDYAVLVADIKQDISAKNLISFSNIQVAIGEQKELEKYHSKAKFYQGNLSLIELKHKQNIEKIPGVLFYLLSRFFQQSISIIELFSVWDSTYILVDKKDVSKIINMYFK